MKNKTVAEANLLEITINIYNHMIKETQHYHEAIIEVFEPSKIVKVAKTKTSASGKKKIPETIHYKKNVYFFAEKKINLKKKSAPKGSDKENDLTPILNKIKQNLKLADRYEIRIKEITNYTKLREINLKKLAKAR